MIVALLVVVVKVSVVTVELIVELVVDSDVLVSVNVTVVVVGRLITRSSTEVAAVMILMCLFAPVLNAIRVKRSSSSSIMCSRLAFTLPKRSHLLPGGILIP